MGTLAYFSMPGGSELLLILFVVLLLFGSKKLPELSRSLGKSLGEFKRGKEEFEREVRSAQQAATTTPPPKIDAKEKDADFGSEKKL